MAHGHAHDHGGTHDDGHGHGHAHGAPHAHGHAHGHGAAQDDGHGSSADERRKARRLLVVLVVVGLFFFVELFGAKVARSDALQADAFHLLMDVLALGISLASARLATRRPSIRLTFGLRRAEPVGALLNGLLVLVAAADIVSDGVSHLREPGEPRSGAMMLFACLALVVNGFCAYVLHGATSSGHGHGHGHGHGGAGEEPHDHRAHTAAHGVDPHEAAAHHHHDLSVRGALLHLIGDVLGSVAAFVAAGVIALGGPRAADPIAGLLVALILVVGAVKLLRDAVVVLLEAAPARLDPAAVRAHVLAEPWVRGLHDLHVWTLGGGHDALMAHLELDAYDPARLAALSASLRRRFRLEYVTLGVHVGDGDACDAPPSRFEPHDA